MKRIASIGPMGAFAGLALLFAGCAKESTDTYTSTATNGVDYSSASGSPAGQSSGTAVSPRRTPATREVTSGNGEVPEGKAATNRRLHQNTTEDTNNAPGSLNH